MDLFHWARKREGEREGRERGREEREGERGRGRGRVGEREGERKGERDGEREGRESERERSVCVLKVTNKVTILTNSRLQTQRQLLFVIAIKNTYLTLP